MGIRYGGRQKGTPNKATTELAQRFRRFVEDAKAVKRMREEYQAGTLHPMLVKLFFEYAYGKPKETVDVPQLSALTEALAKKVVHELHPGPGKTA